MNDQSPGLAHLENTVLGVSPSDTPDLSQSIFVDDLAPATDTPEAAPEVLELISPEVWAQQWGLMHDMAGGMVQMRTDVSCPLGSQARSEGGMIACNAAYELISISPAAALILGAHSTFFGQILAVGMHGFACVQLVKASRDQGRAAQFASSRAEAA